MVNCCEYLSIGDGIREFVKCGWQHVWQCMYADLYVIAHNTKQDTKHVLKSLSKEDSRFPLLNSNLREVYELLPHLQ